MNKTFKSRIERLQHRMSPPVLRRQAGLPDLVDYFRKVPDDEMERLCNTHDGELDRIWRAYMDAHGLTDEAWTRAWVEDEKAGIHPERNESEWVEVWREPEGSQKR